MEEKTFITSISTVIAIVILAVISALIISSITSTDLLDCTNITGSNSSNITVESTTTLSPVGDGITSSEVKAYNSTWLDFDGIDDSVESERYDTISFWYKNSSVDWTFIVNSSGTLYVNGVVGTPDIYPVYDNGTKMFLGKTGASTFFNGSMDDFRGYASSIDPELINLTYLGGRI